MPYEVDTNVSTFFGGTESLGYLHQVTQLVPGSWDSNLGGIRIGLVCIYFTLDPGLKVIPGKSLSNTKLCKNTKYKSLIVGIEAIWVELPAVYIDKCI